MISWAWTSEGECKWREVNNFQIFLPDSCSQLFVGLWDPTNCALAPSGIELVDQGCGNGRFICTVQCAWSSLMCNCYKVPSSHWCSEKRGKNMSNVPFNHIFWIGETEMAPWPRGWRRWWEWWWNCSSQGKSPGNVKATWKRTTFLSSQPEPWNITHINITSAATEQREQSSRERGFHKQQPRAQSWQQWG